jgi:hypothetical protein
MSMIFQASNTNRIFTLSFALLTALLTACGGGSDAGDRSGSGTLTVGISDAPVDHVSAICVDIESVSVKPESGPAIELPLEFAPDSCTNLLEFTGVDREMLVEGFSLPAGEYEWMRFDVDASCDGVTMGSSYVEHEDGRMFDLRVPSARGLQLSSGFVITANQQTDFTIEWNMRMGLTDPVGQPDCYKLKPSLRVLDDTSYGHITGTVSQPLLASDGPLACTSDPNTEAGNEVYVFANPDEIDDIDGDGDPYATAPVRYNADTTEYEYTVGYVEEGLYTVAFTCQGTDDVIPDEENPPPQGQPDPADNDILFTTGVSVTVSAEETAIVNFD